MKKPKWVALLKQARERIANRESEFVCYAIRDSNGTALAKAGLIREIERRLGGIHTVRTWLADTQSIRWSKLTTKTMRDYRVRWIDSMIEEFS